MHVLWKKIQINVKKSVSKSSGGYCKLNKELLGKQMDHMSALQSWAPELRNFVELNERPIDENRCDLVYEKPVYIMKIDASTLQRIFLSYRFVWFMNLWLMSFLMRFQIVTCIIISVIFSICMHRFTLTWLIRVRLTQTITSFCGKHTIISRHFRWHSKHLPTIQYSRLKHGPAKMFALKILCYHCYLAWFSDCTIIRPLWVEPVLWCDAIRIINFCIIFQIFFSPMSHQLNIDKRMPE